MTEQPEAPRPDLTPEQREALHRGFLGGWHAQGAAPDADPEAAFEAWIAEWHGDPEPHMHTLARYLRDLAGHPRYIDPPRGRGWQALLESESDILMCHRLAMEKHGQTAAAEINQARDVLLTNTVVRWLR